MELFRDVSGPMALQLRSKGWLYAARPNRNGDADMVRITQYPRLVMLFWLWEIVKHPYITYCNYWANRRANAALLNEPLTWLTAWANSTHLKCAPSSSQLLTGTFNYQAEEQKLTQRLAELGNSAL